MLTDAATICMILGTAGLAGIVLGLLFRSPMLIVASLLAAPATYFAGRSAGFGIAMAALDAFAALVILQLGYLGGVALAVRIWSRADGQARLPRVFQHHRGS
jgi:hypothetical protein